VYTTGKTKEEGLPSGWTQPTRRPGKPNFQVFVFSLFAANSLLKSFLVSSVAD